MKLYLAGPEVFLDDARAQGRRKLDLCRAYGFEGLFPLDGEPVMEGAGMSAAIFFANLDMIRAADAIVANLTPFRGLSADPGTAFELGYGFASGKTVAAYSNLPGDLLTRARHTIGAAEDIDAPPTLMRDGMHAEDFGLFDNLMLAEALKASGFPVLQAQSEPADPMRDLELFQRTLEALAQTGAAGTRKEQVCRR
ncbi:nucleoside 2-deoxyribosyltransferase [Xanthobacter sp. TB0136]|uniref:nucleoside 2-deoxyribosyltransferase n=1 Tax=Xanthobacter sp. TB0136 TaxID=3459177 RepID=UPI004039FFD1